MKIFVDANILVSVLNKEYPTFTYASRILSLSENPKFQLYTSPICLAIAFYFAEKKSGTSMAKNKMALLNSNLKVSIVGQEAVTKCLQNKKINDFEDGLEYYSAVEAGCTCIITEDTKDFYFSEIDVLNSEAFIKKLFYSKFPK
jgi:predicted nucleic acid-binding protein